MFFFFFPFCTFPPLFYVCFSYPSSSDIISLSSYVLTFFTYFEIGSYQFFISFKMFIFGLTKELSFCHELKFSNPYIFVTWWCTPLIFQTKNIWSNIIYTLKYLRSTTLGLEDIGITISEFVAKTQFLWLSFLFLHFS